MDNPARRVGRSLAGQGMKALIQIQAKSIAANTAAGAFNSINK
jgi:hypothetical protein